MDVGKSLLFDRQALEEEWDADCAVKLAQAFVTDTEGIPEQISAALEKHDSATVCASAHRLAGCCKVIMCTLLADKCAALEKAAAGGDWDKAGGLFTSSVAPVYRDLRKEVCDYLASV